MGKTFNTTKTTPLFTRLLQPVALYVYDDCCARNNTSVKRLLKHPKIGKPGPPSTWRFRCRVDGGTLSTNSVPKLIVTRAILFLEQRAAFAGIQVNAEEALRSSV
ncbi:hypothetical protein GWI33_001146 [Rhynchophorus ferrugineus]|uniref:Uncharacterized protein n=1 Tax=Rhynchophorus ferrugineus TaxID=354439 RepID=A0A834IP05_RHYFE|nr:hypothetical protein GWI33_001146 [Rhynchophorus ferrugineus]